LAYQSWPKTLSSEGVIMSRCIAVLVLVGVVAGMGVMQHHLAAQAVVDVPTVVSPTYIATPPPQQEVITTAPSPQYVWVPGQWDRTPDKWSWSTGKWVQPPFGNAYWVPGYWKHNGGQYVWHPAHWAAANQGVIVNKPVTIPPVYAEVQPTAPAGATNLVWQPGYWDWRGTWVWVPGAYVATSSPKAVWVQGEWESTADGTWRWNPAHWALA
jgi:hypothetical protein